MEFTKKPRYGIADFLEIVRILRAPGGCPWDREQTHASIRKNLIEETYEVAEAIDQADDRLLCEELGDLLLQVALHAQIAGETGAFTFEDVCDGVSKKLIYRHPHVFGEFENGISSSQVLHNWENLKNTEKGRETAADRLGSVPASLPALMYAQKVQKRAEDFGFCYTAAASALEDLALELEELRLAAETGGAEGHGAAEEVGDVLFSAVNVARYVGADAEEALSAGSRKFVARLLRAEELAARQGKTLRQLDAAARDALWKAAKRAEESPCP